jgi:type IV pilus assembly protein PilM
VFRRTRSVVGLDIGSSAVKAVELKPSGKGHRIVAFGTEPVPADSIVDGAIVDGAAVADAIRRLFAGQAIKTREVVASVSGNAVIVKKISLPPMSEAELADAIFWEAEQYIPFDVQDVNLDYQIISGATNGHAHTGGVGAASGLEVLLVAAKKEKIADYTGVIVQAGLVPVVVDVDAFAVQNAYEANYGADPAHVVVLLNVGASAMNLNVLNGEHSFFTRDISVGGHAYTDALQKEFRLSAEDAERLKRGQAVDGLDFEQARPVLRAVTEGVLLEVQKTFDFFRGATGMDHIDRVVLSGGGSRVDGLAEMIGERFDTTVEDLDPFRTVAFDAARWGVEAADVAPVSAVAVGLALRKVGDR